MQKITKTIIFSILAITTSLLAAREDTLEKTFNVNSGGTLNVDTDRGSITITTHGSDRVDIAVHRKVDAWTNGEADALIENFNIEFDKRGNDVYITGEWEDKDAWSNKKRNRLKLKYEITNPEKYNVELKTAGGSISVADLNGDVKAKTSGGSLKFGDIKGPVWGRTSGGSIKLIGCIGDADVKTSGGSIKIGEVDGNVLAHTSGGSINIDKAKGTVSAKTSGGGIHVKEVMGEIDASTSGGSVSATITKQPKNSCRLSTSGGSVKVYLADDIGVDLDAKTSGGHVQTDFPVTIKGKINKRALRTEINGGGPELKLRTSGGSIYLKQK